MRIYLHGGPLDGDEHLAVIAFEVMTIPYPRSQMWPRGGAARYRYSKARSKPGHYHYEFESTETHENLKAPKDG